MKPSLIRLPATSKTSKTLSLAAEEDVRVPDEREAFEAWKTLERYRGALSAARLDADELVELSVCGLEERTWKALVKSEELPARKIGRKFYTTRSALVRLVLDAPTPPSVSTSKPSTDDDAYAELVAKAGGRR